MTFCVLCGYVYSELGLLPLFCIHYTIVTMEAGEDQNSGSANGNTQSGGNSRAPQIAHMSLYERQAVQVRA